VNLHEYQAREILARHGIPLPGGAVATTPEEARAIAARLGGPVVVKAQVHAGGRGKAGGVKLARDASEAAEHAARILGMTIKGLTVRQVLVAPAADIASESYVGIIVDRASQRPVLMVSGAGGIDIEEVAARTPDRIHRLAVDPRYGLLPHQALGLALHLYRDVGQARAAADIMQKLYAAVYAVGASLAEINPLATTPERPGHRARREGRDRRQRAGAPSGDRGAARRDGRGPLRGSGTRGRAHVHQARGLGGLLRQRGRARDGDHGPREVLRRRARQLPRHRRQLEPPQGRGRPPDHHR